MALELRPNCEYCGVDLPPDSMAARICSYECTFCAECVERLQNVCPNCGGGFAGSGLLPDEVPIIARRGELVVPAERVVREEKTARERRPITVVVNVTAADASSFRDSQGQIAADMARAIDRASRNR